MDELASMKILIEAEDRASAVISNVGNSLESLGSASSSAAYSTAAVNNTLDSTAKSGKTANNAITSYGQQLQNTGKSIKEVGEGINNIAKPLQVASVAIAGLSAASAMTAISFEDNFASVKKTVEGTDEELAQIKQDIIDMTTVSIDGHSAIPQTTAELTELAAAGGQLGIKTENISAFTETMAMLGSATNLAGETGAQTLARFMNVTNTSQDEIDNLGSSIVDLGNNFATTEAEIADMALSMGATGSVVGISAQDVLAYSTALSSLGVEAAAGGSAVSRIWMEIQSAVSAGGEDLQKFAELSGKSSEDFAEQWQNDASGAFRDFLKGLNESSDQISVLSELGFNNIRDIQALQRLAGEKGFDLLTDAIERSNTAWSENTALLTEFEAKAETTASKIQVAKNNAVEATRSFGEIMLPTIVDVTGGLANMTQGLASMSDGTKKFVVGTGAAVVGLGALSKGAAGTIKTVGGVVEGVGNLKKAAEGTGSVAKLASGFLSVGKYAGPAALGIAGVTAAVIVGTKAYDAWYTSQYRWSEGLSEGNQKISESLNKYKDISSIQNEIKDLRLTIENPESSSEQVATAKSRLEEIKELLSKEYNLVINSDNSNLESVAETAKNLNKTQLQLNMSSQNAKLVGLKDKFDSFNQKEYENIISEQAKLGELIVKAQEIDKKYSGTSTDTEVLKKRAEALNELGKAYGYSSGEIAAGALNVSDLSIRYEELGDRIQKLTDQKTSHDEYIAISTELANWNTELLQMSAASADAEGVAQALSNIGMYVRNAELDMNGYAQAAALAMNGVDKLETAWEQAWNGDNTALTGIVNDYIRSMKEFGASAQETAVGASLIQNGFRTIEEAAEKGELDTVIQQANELAHSMRLIPEDKHIVINTQGDISVIEDVQEAVEQVNAVGDVNLQVSANGDISVLDTADEKLQELIANNQVTITFNVDTGGFDISDLQGNKLGEITADGKINWTKGEVEKPEGEKADGTIDYKLGEVEKPENATATGTINYKLGTVERAPLAKGTTNFPGGLAMVNDERGRSDNRELIVDRGRAFIPEGRDVILPLSRGAKVYTAAQTKAIMSGLGIPHYASGKNNSDAFTAAKDDWTHYTKTHSVTTAQELEKWLEFQEKYKDNEKDIWDIEEQIFSLQQKLYSERVKESENWLRHEEKYNGMSVDDYLAGIDRMKAYTEEYYAQGLLNHKEYTEAMLDLDEKYIDKRKEQLSEQYDLSSAYISEHTNFNDWDDNGDNPLDAYNRVMDRNREALANGELTQNEFDEYKDKLGSQMLSERTEQSLNWLDEQRKYFGMTDEEYVQGLERIKAYTQQYYEQGLIGRQEYNEAMTDLNHKSWDEAESAYEDMLADQQKYISDLQEEFSKQEQALRDSWTVEDRKVDMADVQNQLNIYAGAVTDRGQQKYKELEAQMKQLQRDEEMYQLQVKNTATIDALQADYKQLEADKTAFLKGIAETNINISGIVGDLTSGIKQSDTDIKRTLSEIIDAIHEIKIEQSYYNDNSQTTINAADNVDVMAVTKKNVGL